MNKVLVTGGSHAELPLINALHELGYYVITTGNDEMGLGHRVSDEYCKGDYSDKEFVLRLAEKENVKGIVSGCNDFAYLSTAYACEKLNLPGHDTYENAKIIHYKNRFRQILMDLKLPYPECQYCYTQNDAVECSRIIGFPLVVKPIDLTGGKGVSICNNEKELLSAFNIAKIWTRQQGVLIEKYVKGTNHGASMLLVNGKVQFCFVDNEQYYLNPYLVAGACTSYDISNDTRRKIVCDVEKIFENCPLRDGLFHCQLIITDEGIPYMIDPCRRTPGDLYVDLVKYATGIHYSKAIVKSELGMDFVDLLENDEERYVARECIMTNENGIVDHIKISNDYKKYIIDKLIWAKQGDLIEDYMKYKAGILFLEFSDKEELKEKINAFYNNVETILKEEEVND